MIRVGCGLVVALASIWAGSYFAHMAGEGHWTLVPIMFTFGITGVIGGAVAGNGLARIS